MYDTLQKYIHPLKSHRTSFGLCAALAVYFLLFPQYTISWSSWMTSKVMQQFDQAFLVFCSLISCLVFIIAFSPIGKLKLGKDDDQPQFSTVTWIAMLFAAGMGSGLVFWGIAEPVYHQAYAAQFFASPANETPQDIGLGLTYFHWGIHAWSIYVIVGLTMAWFYSPQKTPHENLF